jgi:hypothetical protein
MRGGREREREGAREREREVERDSVMSKWAVPKSASLVIASDAWQLPFEWSISRW